MTEKILCNYDNRELFDTARSARHIQAVDEAIWWAHEDGRAPAAFAVEV